MSEVPPRQQFVLDTSLFITEGIRRDDESLDEALLRLLDLIATARLELNVSCYMPPSIHDELATMLRDRDVSEEVFSKLDTWVVRKSPDRYGVQIPADIVYQFVDEMSDRVDRGLRVSEEAVREVEGLDPETLTSDGADGGETSEDARSEYMTEADRVVSDLRDKYRRALRTGVLDSREDFDLLVLARELEAGVVTEDRGIISWADQFGLRYVRGRQFPTLLHEYLRASGVDGYAEAEVSSKSAATEGTEPETESAAGDPGTDESGADESGADESITDESVTDESVTDESVADGDDAE